MATIEGPGSASPAPDGPGPGGVDGASSPPRPPESSPDEPGPEEAQPEGALPPEAASKEPPPGEPVPEPDEPHATDGEPTQPEPVQPEPVQPEPVQPGLEQPEVERPPPVAKAAIDEPLVDQAEPEPVEPEPVEPEPVEPEPVEPAPVEPEPVEPAPRLEQPGPDEPLPTEPTPEQPLPEQPQPAPEPRPVLVAAPAPPSLRERLVPRSVLGVAALVLAFAVGAAFSGAVFYSYYEFKKDRTEKRVASFVQGFDKRFEDALATIEAEGHNARAEIQRELEPLRKTRAEGQTLEALIKKVEPSMFFVTTLDEAGQPSVGSAFAVASDGQQTLLLTSYTTIKAATRQPGPALRVRKGNQDVRATLWTWHDDKDLALITLARGDVPTLAFGSDRLRPGERLFAVSALGGAGGSVTQGLVADVSATGVQHDAAIGQAFQGGPLVNSDGAVLAVASRSYSPLGFSSDQVFFAPFVAAACEKVLRCGPGPPGVGERGAPARR